MKRLQRQMFTTDVTTDDPECTDVLKKITEAVGEPKNYGPSEEEQEAESRRLAEARQQRLALEAVQKRLRDEAELGELATQHEEWVSREKSLHQ